jgi:hypothetical protein
VCGKDNSCFAWESDVGLSRHTTVVGVVVPQIVGDGVSHGFHVGQEFGLCEN